MIKLRELKGKKILILGFAREGKDSFLFLRKLFPKKTIGVADKSKDLKSKIYNLRSDKNIKWHLGENYLEALKNYDLVIKSPGIPFKILPKPTLKKITTQTEIFFNNCPGKIVGVTGTKGKSTTASLIYQTLKACPDLSRRAHLVGNIEKPVLSSLLRAKTNDIFVYELSSHQLYNLKKSPQIAVFLNIFPEHLDYYRNFKEYARAKANITLHQKKNDFLVFNVKDRNIREFAKKSPAQKIPIKGEYYDLNKAAAKAVGGIFKISPETIKKTIKRFKSLPHRLELVGKFKGITFYNDSLATIPEATIGAMEYLGREVETIILGGLERNIDFKNLAKKILNSKIKTLILFPTTGEKIWKTLVRQARDEKKLPGHFFIHGAMKNSSPCAARCMQDAVKIAYKHTGKGKICLLSAASASFNMFRDYRERGFLFKKYVRQMAKK